MIKAIFFDWFNTLAHYYPPREELESQALKELGFDISPKAIAPALYLADKYFFEENARLPVRQRSKEDQVGVYIASIRIVLKETGITPTDDLARKLLEKMSKLYAGMNFILFDDVIPTLKTLKEKKLTVGLLSNIQNEIDSLCHGLGLDDYLDFTVTSLQVGSEKPKPPMFLKALELAEVQPREAMHIGDQYQNDIVGARGVGISPVLLDRGDYYPEITDCPRIKSLPELLNIID